MRRSLRTLLLLSALALAGPLAGHAGVDLWTPMGPPAAFGVERLTADPNEPSTIYAESGAAGIWKSRDGGETWSAVNGGLPASPASFTAHPSSPGVLYAGLVMPQVTAPGLWRSIDGGGSWREIAEAPAFGALPRSEVVVTSSGLLYWVESGTPYRSPDGGNSWECLAAPVSCVPNPEVEAFAVAPSNPSTLYALVDAGLLRSTDAGSSWEGPVAVTPFSSLQGSAHGGRPDRIAVSPDSSEVVFAWRSNGAGAEAGSPCFARSDDGGRTWRTFLDDRQCGAPALDPRHPATVRLSSAPDRRIQESRDGGETWREIGQAPVEGRLLADPTDPEGLFLGGSDRLLRSRDGGRTWAPVRGGMITAGAQLLEPSAEAPGTLFATFAPPAPKPPADGRSWRTLRKTTNLGRTWTELPLARVTALGVDPRDPTHLLAARLSFQGATVSSRISESRDGGQLLAGVLQGSLPGSRGRRRSPVSRASPWSRASPSIRPGRRACSRRPSPQASSPATTADAPGAAPTAACRSAGPAPARAVRRTRRRRSSAIRSIRGSSTCCSRGPPTAATTGGELADRRARPAEGRGHRAGRRFQPQDALCGDGAEPAPSSGAGSPSSAAPTGAGKPGSRSRSCRRCSAWTRPGCPRRCATSR